MKKKHLCQRSQAIIIGLSVALLLFSIIIFLIWYNSKKHKEKNNILFRQYESVLASKVKTIKNDKNSLENLSLFDKISLYIWKQEAFKKADLTRDDVAKELSTNRQYLVDAIKNETGQTFLDFVNQCRLEYARERLIQDENTPVSNIVFESGFSSIPTFYRLFKKEFGMSPNEMRQVKKKCG